MAAMLLGAHLAEHVRVPGLQFKKIAAFKVMCTQQFVEDYRSVCKVLQKAPTVQWLDLEQFGRSLAASPKKSHVLFRAAGEDAAVNDFPAHTMKVTRTLKEFLMLFRSVGAGMPKG